MRKIIFAVGVLVVALAAGLVWAKPLPTTISVDPATPVTSPLSPKVSLHDTMRVLWTDHCAWSRMVIMGVFSDLKGCEIYKDRLVQNAKDLETLLLPFYGDGAGKFGYLFQEHIALAGKVLYAIKSDDQTFRSLLSDWYKNGDQIAELLYQLDPKNFPLDQTELMWRMHLDTVLDQAFAYYKSDWQNDVRAYDAMQGHGLQMADFLTRGIQRSTPK